MKNRLQSLDIFRGITIAFMIIVNTPGDWSIAYNMLEHAAWHGFTPTDLVFPSFVFITGVSSWFSYKKYNHTLSSDLMMKIWKRTLIIFLLGVGLYAFPFYNRPIGTWRILGVLQRIALCYGIGSTLCLLLNKKQIIALGAGLLLAYWAIMLSFGDLTMGGNAGLKLDLWLFGEGHLYHGEGIAFDPEGLLSTLPALVTFLMGYITGQFIGTTSDKTLIVKQLAIWGVMLVVVGLLWNFAFPINKKLWTSSYVLFVGGLSMLIFDLCYYVVDVKGHQQWGKFFTVFGTNAILAYMVSELLIIIISNFIHVTDASGKVLNGHEVTFKYFFASWAGATDFASLLFALSFMLVCWGITGLFYRKDLFLKV